MRHQRQPSKAFVRAWRHLLGQARACAERRQDRLPTCRELAHGCDVAPDTMRRAVHTLADRGVLTVSTRSGIRIAGKIPAVTEFEAIPHPPAADSRRHDALEMLRQDILRGRYPPGSDLPTRKELCDAYGVAPLTLRRHLLRLDREGLLKPAGRSYRVEDLPQVHSGGAILVVLSDPDYAHLQDFTPRSQQFWRELEYACRWSSIQMITCSAQKLTRAFPAELTGGRPVLGAIVIASTLSEKELVPLVRRIARPAQPCVIFDETDLDRLRDCAGACAKIRRAQFYPMGTTALPGEIVGRFLLRLGHRRVAFFNLQAGDKVMLRRLHSIQETFARAGYEDAVVRFTSDRIKQSADTLKAIHRHPIYGQLTREGTALLDRLQAESHMPANVGLRPDIARYASSNFLYEHMTPLFSNAFRDREITAWVGGTDRIALMARSFLQTRGRGASPPKSIVGFDNSVLAFTNGISSYDFNVPATVQHMMNHLLRPERRPKRSKGPRIVEIPGFVMARSSTSSVPRSLP